MPSIVDVARKAQVAPSTVSLVINGRRNVTAGIRQRVQSAIDELGYVPRIYRKRKRRERRHVAIVYTRDVVHGGVMAQLCQHWVKGIRDVVGTRGVALGLVAGVDHVDHDLVFNEMIEQRQFDGVILFGSSGNNGYLNRLVEAEVPMVAMNRNPEHQNQTASVMVDFYGGGRQAAELLIRKGHQRLAFVHHRGAHWTTHRYRQGFEDAVAEAGIEPIDLPSLDIQQQTDAVLDKVLDQGITGIGTGDIDGIELIDRLEQRGRHVPGDLSVVGFDNLDLTSKSGKRLTSVGYHKLGMGRLAARLLLQLMSSRRLLATATMVLSTHICLGQTVAPPPTSG